METNRVTTWGFGNLILGVRSAYVLRYLNVPSKIRHDLGEMVSYKDISISAFINGVRYSWYFERLVCRLRYCKQPLAVKILYYFRVISDLSKSLHIRGSKLVNATSTYTKSQVHVKLENFCANLLKAKSRFIREEKVVCVFRKRWSNGLMFKICALPGRCACAAPLMYINDKYESKIYGRTLQ